jgi:hypothetical protein
LSKGNVLDITLFPERPEVLGLDSLIVVVTIFYHL